MGLLDKTPEEYYLGPDGVWNSNDEEYGNYQFVPINDIITNHIDILAVRETSFFSTSFVCAISHFKSPFFKSFLNI